MNMMAWIHPGSAILIGVLIVGLLTWFFWPGRGLSAFLNRARMNTRRVQLEDMLKYLFMCEYRHTENTLHSIAGKLNISVDKAVRLLDHLSSMSLITMTDRGFQLTETGRSYALRIIRVHRIWERYLADETGVRQADWHGEADFQEHQMTIQAADALAAQIGNPAYDPHGDPIPSASGELPGDKGRPFSTLHEGDRGSIVRIQDEPRFIYEQIGRASCRERV
jgi:DtxR family Mn-dependent transcriptional regulator